VILPSVILLLACHDVTVPKVLPVSAASICSLIDFVIPRKISTGTHGKERDNIETGTHTSICELFVLLTIQGCGVIVWDWIRCTFSSIPFLKRIRRVHNRCKQERQDFSKLNNRHQCNCKLPRRGVTGPVNGSHKNRGNSVRNATYTPERYNSVNLRTETHLPIQRLRALHWQPYMLPSLHQHVRPDTVYINKINCVEMGSKAAAWHNGYRFGNPEYISVRQHQENTRTAGTNRSMKPRIP
jgi:hypothetical protein